MTALGGKGYSYLTIPGADPIPVDTEDLSDRTDDDDAGALATKKKKREMRQDNAAAFNMLIQAMDTSTEKGKVAFYKVKSAMDKTNYRCGHFANAWEKKLRAKYETEKKPDLQEEQEKYYSKRMKEKENPETFILGMEIMRSKLENLGEVIPEDKFIKDPISKLPKSKAAGQLSPYQLKADAWKARVGAVVDPL